MPADRPVPAADTVYVVRFALDHGEGDASPLSLLDRHERERADRLAVVRDKQRFVVAHAGTRMVLGRFLNAPPESIRFAFGPQGKPRIVEPPLDLRFNLTHSEDTALLAVSVGRELGVDLERERPIEVLPLSRRMLTDAERTVLGALPEHERTQAFFRCWARKESFAKALGSGLTLPLAQVRVGFGRRSSPFLVTDEGAEVELRGWTVVSLRAPIGSAAALTVEGTGWRVVYVSGIGGSVEGETKATGPLDRWKID
jgi:4'-phosphopantetheinyl transferase